MLKNRNLNEETCESFITEEGINHQYEKVRALAKAVDPLTRQVKDLKLSDESSSVIKGDGEMLAGQIESIIPTIRTVVIKRSGESELLNIGTTIFISQKSSTDGESVFYEIGTISDIFGCIEEPMYSLELNEDAIMNNLLTVGSKVFYLPNHASTGFVYVQHHNNDRYAVKSKLV